MKDAYGVNNGSEEYLVNINELIKKFDGFQLVENKNFMDNFNEINKSVKNNIKYKFQKDILSLHKILIFKRK
jgi:hypothetical protein